MTKRTGVLALSGVLLAAVAIALGSAASSAAPQKRRVINLPNRNVQAPFSDGILVGDTLYLAGRLGLDPKTNQPPEDPEQEARLLLDGMQSVLKAAGMTMDDLATVTVYSPDVSLYTKFNGVYRTYFQKEFPARAFVGSGALLFGARFEVQAIAVKQ